MIDALAERPSGAQHEAIRCQSIARPGSRFAAVSPVPSLGSPWRPPLRPGKEAFVDGLSTGAANAVARRSGIGSMTRVASASMSDRPDEMSLGIDGFALGANGYRCAWGRSRGRARIRALARDHGAELQTARNGAQPREPCACSWLHLALRRRDSSRDCSRDFGGRNAGAVPYDERQHKQRAAIGIG